MGFLDRVKRAVGGPVELVIDAPEEFRWADGRLPVTLTLSNSTDAPVQVAEVRVKLSSERSRFSRKRTLADEFTVAPGASETRSIEVPLQVDTSPAAMQGAASAAGLPPAVGSVISAGIGPADNPGGKHRIEVVVKLADSARLSNASTTITAR